ncbi:MAG: site-2 protease family protein [Defluviitaleaceae bacterium]|nr:site-2 protease family protein [Defluviitaleaceae bacterium]MCL2263765.1 site-2 protease family protein [Defluviitaleaceae bacterium]
MNLLYLLPGAFFAPVIHEFVKARVSAKLGDLTPAKNGFITWNPFRFFEPIGFFLMLFFQVGWGQPVTTSPFYYRDKRKGIILTYTAPMVANLLVGMVAIFLANNVLAGLVPWQANLVLLHFGTLNIRLAAFNLIPVFPMAANKLLHLFVSPETSMRLNHYEKPLQILLFLLLVFNVVEMVVGPISMIFIRAVW